MGNIPQKNNYLSRLQNEYEMLSHSLELSCPWSHKKERFAALQVTVTKLSFYIIQNNELYDIYYQNELFLTTDSIEYLNPDIPIFQSKGDESYEQKEIY